MPHGSLTGKGRKEDYNLLLSLDIRVGFHLMAVQFSASAKLRGRGRLMLQSSRHTRDKPS
jgi:hypothetical protein